MPSGPTAGFQLVSDRYERGSMILTSNTRYGDCGIIPQDNHSTTINIKGGTPSAEGQAKGRSAGQDGDHLKLAGQRGSPPSPAVHSSKQ